MWNFKGGRKENKETKINNESKSGRLSDFFKTKKGKIVGVFGAMYLSLFVGMGMGEDSMSDEINEITSDSNFKITNLEKKITELEGKVKEADPWFKMTEEEKIKLKEENAKIEAEKLAVEEKKKEEERLAKEEAEKNKYNTNLTYNDLARNPGEYVLDLFKFEGEVIQVMEGNTYNQIRLAVGGNYDNVMFVEYKPEIISNRVLEGDYISVYGIGSGLVSYTSTLGAKISIPGMVAEKIDM